jgi:hypothetical protein
MADDAVYVINYIVRRPLIWLPSSLSHVGSEGVEGDSVCSKVRSIVHGHGMYSAPLL